MPWSAADSVCWAWPIESSSELRSLARLLNDCEVKKLDGLSSAELTFLPVARRPCVAESSEAVLCSERRFCRTPADRVMLDIVEPFWSMALRAVVVPDPSDRGRRHLMRPCNGP